ncbi:CAT RNA binding domain-containing protein [Tetragenococcus solitarius]|uniref:CAT RNA-binding domain-containing protein n=1 Tax=Tetragenococcus solitarius TaxID=71453 RepID=A0ABN3Y4C7_9ENTE|nr:CAT RNA binding domain-containing protein [Tetragenococcus solitarius]
MKILQVFSHNALVAKSENNESMVLVGRGIGFNKKKGDRINENAASQIFVEKRQQENETH